MSTPAKHIYATLPDEAHKRTPVLGRCRSANCGNQVFLQGLCRPCYTILHEWYETQWSAQEAAKRRAEFRARFFAAAWNGFKVTVGIALYLACVVGLLCLMGYWRGM